MTNLESDGTHISQDLAVLVHESGERMGLCGRESVGRTEGLRGNHTLLEVNVFSLFQPDSVNEGHPDHLRDDSLLVLPRFAHESCIKGAITVRGGVLKFTLVVDNDTTLHGGRTDTVAFSPTVPIECSVCSHPHALTHTSLEWLKKTIHDK